MRNHFLIYLMYLFTYVSFDTPCLIAHYKDVTHQSVDVNEALGQNCKPHQSLTLFRIIYKNITLVVIHSQVKAVM